MVFLFLLRIRFWLRVACFFFYGIKIERLIEIVSETGIELEPVAESTMEIDTINTVYSDKEVKKENISNSDDGEIMNFQVLPLGYICMTNL